MCVGLFAKIKNLLNLLAGVCGRLRPYSPLRLSPECGPARQFVRANAVPFRTPDSKPLRLKKAFGHFQLGDNQIKKEENSVKNDTSI